MFIFFHIQIMQNGIDLNNQRYIQQLHIFLYMYKTKPWYEWFVIFPNTWIIYYFRKKGANKMLTKHSIAAFLF